MLWEARTSVQTSDHFLPFNCCWLPILLCHTSVMSSIHLSSCARPRLTGMKFSYPWITGTHTGNGRKGLSGSNQTSIARVKCCPVYFEFYILFYSSLSMGELCSFLTFSCWQSPVSHWKLLAVAPHWIHDLQTIPFTLLSSVIP